MTYSTEVLADSPLAFYRLGDPSGTTMTDSSGSGRDGTYNGTYTLAQTGLLTGDPDTCVDFAGGRGIVSHGSWMDVSTITVEAWIRPDVVSGQRVIASRDNNGTFGPWRLRTSVNKAQFLLWTSTGVTTLASTANLSTGVTYHIAATWDGTTIRLYINGALDNSVAKGGTINSNTQALRIGDYQAGENFDGKIDEAAFYGAALSGTRIAAHYTAGTTAPAPELSLAGTSPASVGAFAIAAGESLSLAGTSPASVGEFTLRATDVEGAVNVGWDRRRVAVGYAAWEPPVVEAPADLVHDYISAHAYEAVTITEGERPTIPDLQTAELPRHRTRIVVAGRDVTYWRGIQTPDPTYSLISPLLYGSGSIEFPQVHAAFEQPGVGALDWLVPWAPIKVQRVNAEGTVVATDFRGFLMDPSLSGRTLTFGLVGQATGPAAADYRPPRIFRRRNDLGHWWDRMLQMVGVRRGGVALTGIKMQNRGDMTLLDYAQELSAAGVTRSGNQWTAMPLSNGTYEVFRKDTSTIHGTVYFDDAHTVADLRRDPLEEPNTVYATGISPEGRRIRFADYPALQLSEAPPYPGSPIDEGDTSDGAVAVVVRLWQVGYLSYEDRPGGFDADVTRAVKDLQDDADLPQTGIVNEATWDAMFDFAVTGYNLAGAQIRPAAQKKALRKYRRTASGAILGLNPTYDPHAKVVAKAIDVGTGFNQQQVRDFARMEIHEGATANWTGTIKFNLGGYINGEHTPGGAITVANVWDARDIKPGMNLWAPLFVGGTLFHVSGCEVDKEHGRGVVTASVDTRARDTMEVWEVIARNRESRRNPARQWLRDFRSSYLNKDSVTEWDDLGGTIADTELIGDQWNVVPVIAGQEGTVARLRLQLSNDECEFVVGVFGRRIGKGYLAGMIGNPLSEAGSERWTDTDVTDVMRNDRVLLYVAGDDSQPCGYFPKNKTDEDTPSVTGRWEDDASFGYRCFDDYSLWVAIYPAEDCTLQGGRIMWNQLEPGS